MDTELRPVKTSDEDFLFSVYASTRADEMKLVPWTAMQKQSFLQMQFNAQRQHYSVHYPKAQYYIIEQAGQMIGRMIVDRSENTILLMDIALLPEYRNKRIGSGLINTLLEEADKTNRPVQLHVETFNPAMRLYQRLGFVKTGEAGIYHEMTRQPIAEAEHQNASKIPMERKAQEVKPHAR